MNTKRRVKIGIIMGISTLTFGLAAPCFADEAEVRSNYMQLKLGALFPTSDLDEMGFEDGGFNGTLAYGRYLTKSLIIEGSFDISGTEMDTINHSADAGDFDTNTSISTNALLLTLKGEYPLGPINVFGGGGVGIYVASVCADIESERQGDFSVDADDTVFGVHFVAGANYNINNRFFLGLEAMYRRTGDADMSNTSAFNYTVRYNGELSGVIATINAGFRF